VLAAYCATIPGFSSSIVYPSLEMAREFMRVRFGGIIESSPTLSSLMDPHIDSSTLKRFQNGSIVYALSGSGTSRSTTISRSLTMLIADELQFISMKTLTAMASRQRHQENKATIYFSSPRYADSDIDSEIQLCGHIWQAILRCERCNHEFFPSFYDDVRIPRFSDPLSTLTTGKASRLDLNLDDTYLECPRCHRSIPYGYPHTHWVNVAETPNLPKRGMRIGPFDLPRFVSCADLVKDMLRMNNREEFNCQFLALPISHSKNALDITQIQFRHDDSGSLNVFGLDVGKMSCLTIASVSEAGLYIHHTEFLPLKTIREDLPKILSEYRAVAGVIDLLPYTELTAHFVNTIPNTWACIYNNSPAAAKKLELFTLKQKDDPAVGTIKVINCNMTPTFDHFADQISNGLIAYKSSAMDGEITKQLSVMSRQRDYSAGTIDDGSEISYRWRKPNQGRRVNDHIHHSSVMCLLASKLITKNRYSGGLPSGFLVSSFRLQEGF